MNTNGTADQSSSKEEKKAHEKKQDPKERKLKLMSIMGVLEDIFRNSLSQSSSTVPQEINHSARASSGAAEKITLSEPFCYNIHLISMQIIHEHFKGTKADVIVNRISETLGDFLLEDKVVLVLAALAVSYGKFWLTNGQVEENRLLRSVSTFRQLLVLQGCDLVPVIHLEDLTNLINCILDLANCMIELIGEELQSQSELQSSWTLIIDIVVWCIGVRTEYTNSARTQLHVYIDQLKTKHASLKEDLQKIFDSEENEKWDVDCEDITIRIKNFFLRGESLVMWTYKLPSSEECLDKLNGRRIALFISDFNLDLNLEEYNLLVETYYKIKEKEDGKDFEIVWMPMADRSRQQARTKYIIDHLAELMPWCFYCYPTSLTKSFDSYIRNKWNFQKKPILVILDKKGKVDCINAFPLLTVFGELAYPFTSNEADLWKKESWSVEFLLKNIDPQIPAMIEHKKLLCFYGGDDLTWIRNFAKTMWKVMKGTGVRMELIYIGTNGRREKLQDILAAFAQESISQYWTEVMIRSFWFRFQSIFDSRMQLYNTTPASEDDTATKSEAFDDTIIKELMPISTYDSSDLGWVMMLRGSRDIVKASGKQMMVLLESFESWRDKVNKPEDFLVVVEEQLRSHSPGKHCIRSKVPLKGWFNPGQMNCEVCGESMERYCLYTCCKE